jgi:hypothetical protein
VLGNNPFRIRKRVAGVLLCVGAIVAGTTGPAAATGLPGGGGPVVVDVGLDLKTTCKTVFVLAGTAPTVTVTIGGKPTTIDVSAFVSGSVQICVRADVNAVITVNTDTTNPLCPIVHGNINVAADANIFVKISGTGHDGKPKTLNTGDLFGPASGNVPFVVVVCDP